VTQFEKAVSEVSGTQNSYQQGKDFEDYTEQKLEEAGLNATIVPGGQYWSDKFEQNTQVDIEIADDNDELIAIVECKSGGGSTNRQFERLSDLADELGVKFVLATPDGKLDSLKSRDVEILKHRETYLINPDDLHEVDGSSGDGIHEGLPEGFLHSSDSDDLEDNYDDKSSTYDSDSFSNECEPDCDTDYGYDSEDYGSNSDSYDSETSYESYDSGASSSNGDSHDEDGDSHSTDSTDSSDSFW
jgi:hypothetical protein